MFFCISFCVHYTTRRTPTRVTSTGSLLAAAFFAAISSKRFHVASRLALTSSSISSASWNVSKHSLYNSGSSSEKNLQTFSVKLWTAWFQWFLPFLSSEGKITGNITLRFCLIKFSMWSLFHKKKDLSATWRGRRRQSSVTYLNVIQWSRISLVIQDRNMLLIHHKLNFLFS